MEDNLIQELNTSYQ